MKDKNFLIFLIFFVYQFGPKYCFYWTVENLAVFNFLIPQHTVDDSFLIAHIVFRLFKRGRIGLLKKKNYVGR
jgi:hypothetical protein